MKTMRSTAAQEFSGRLLVRALLRSTSAIAVAGSLTILPAIGMASAAPTIHHEIYSNCNDKPTIGLWVESTMGPDLFPYCGSGQMDTTMVDVTSWSANTDNGGAIVYDLGGGVTGTVNIDPGLKEGRFPFDSVKVVSIRIN